ncbi:MAG: glycosyltransferase [Gemmataceae bacterium]
MIPRISIIVASYNYGRYIAEALTSVQAQTFADFECIILDDGSTDDSLGVIERFLEDDRFRLICQRHGGQPRAKNRGIELAHGDYLAFLDADDIWEPTKIARQLALFDARPDLGVVFTQRRLIGVNGEARPGGDNPPPEPGVAAMYRQNFICFSSAMLRAGVPEHVGRFDERIGLAIDYDFWLRVARFYPIACVDEPLVRYRVGHVNLSRRQLDRLHVALLIMERFRRQFDTPAQLGRETVSRAEAETFAHLGVVSRGYSARSAVGWYARSLKAAPFFAEAWRGLASTLTPSVVRRAVRRLRGRDGAWEALCHSPFNRPEAIL